MALLQVAQAPPATEVVVEHPASEAERIPLEAADHVATIALRPDDTPSHRETITFTRHGSRYRIDRRRPEFSSASYTNLSSGITVTVVPRQENGYRALAIQVPDRGPSGESWRRTLTRDTDTALGEHCRVWRTVKVGTSEDEFNWSNCLTSDGIELWASVSGMASQSTYSSIHSTTLAVQRRAVSANEVTPSPEAFDLWAWLAERGIERDSRNNSAQPGFEVRLQSTATHDQMKVVSSVIRGRGMWRYQENHLSDGRTEWLVHNRQIGFAFHAVRLASGEVRRLNMYLHPADQRPISMLPWEPMATDRTGSFLGEECRWYDPSTAFGSSGEAVLSIEAPIMITHRHEEKCWTGDGIVLAWNRSFDSAGGDSAALEAVELTRRSIQLTEVLPPSFLLDAGRWGAGE